MAFIANPADWQRRSDTLGSCSRQRSWKSVCAASQEQERGESDREATELGTRVAIVV